VAQPILWSGGIEAPISVGPPRDRGPTHLVDRRDNDPVVLLSYIATALARVEPVDPGLFSVLAAPGVSVAATAVPRLLATAELRLLPLLATHLTLAEIGQRLQEIGLLGV
jgi:hypothetical protein